jgi:hypothetical protein
LDCRNFKEFQNPEECNSYVLLASGAVWIGAMNLTVPLEKHASLCKMQKQNIRSDPKVFADGQGNARVKDGHQDRSNICTAAMTPHSLSQPLLSFQLPRGSSA